MRSALPTPRTPWQVRALLALLLVGGAVLGAATAEADEPAGEPVVISASDEAGEYAYDEPRIEEKLGDVIPKGIMFRDENGKPVELRSLMTKPTVLLLVYLRCPNVCSPLMREVAHTVEEVELISGEDFNLVTVSFDARETPDLARRGKANLLGGMKKEIDPGSWDFLTGNGANIRKLCDAVGFYFMRDKEDYLHASAVIFVSTDGKIVRYLYPFWERSKEDRNETVPAILPFDMTMAVNDARDGNARSFMQRLQKLCYAYDPDGRAYVINVNRIILVVTLIGLAIFLAVLLLKRKKNPTPVPTAKAAGDEAIGGGHA